MRTILRAILLWVMVLAVPVQGMAASLMTFCGPSHERMMQGMGAEHPGHVAAQRHVHSEASPIAAHNGPDAGVGSVHDGMAQDSGGLFVLLGQFSCSACAACCAVMGLPSRLSLPGQPESAAAIPSSLSVSVQSHLPEGLDRPPRADLA